MREKLSTHIFYRLCAEELTIRDLMLSLSSLCTSSSAALSLFLLPKFSCFLGRLDLLLECGYGVFKLHSSYKSAFQRW